MVTARLQFLGHQRSFAEFTREILPLNRTMRIVLKRRHGYTKASLCTQTNLYSPDVSALHSILSHYPTHAYKTTPQRPSNQLYNSHSTSTINISASQFTTWRPTPQILQTTLKSKKSCSANNPTAQLSPSSPRTSSPMLLNLTSSSLRTANPVLPDLLLSSPRTA